MYRLNPEQVLIHRQVTQNPRWHERAQRVCSGLGAAGASPTYFTDDDIPDLASEYNWAAARRRMGHFPDLEDPDVLLNVFTLDDSNVGPASGVYR